MIRCSRDLSLRHSFFIGLTLENNEEVDNVFIASKSIVSGVGIIGTYTRLIPSEDVSGAMRSQLSILNEARPKVYATYWIEGDGQQLGLSSTDFVEVAHQFGEYRLKKGHITVVPMMRMPVDLIIYL
jgi:hypothetical protein